VKTVPGQIQIAMKTILTPPARAEAGEAGSLTPREWLRRQPRPRAVVILFDDAHSLRPAMDLYQKVIIDLWGRNLECTWWKLDSLSDSSIADAATRSAANAGLIILSVHAETDLSEAAKSWVEAWFYLAERIDRSVLVMVNGELPPTLLQSPALAFLEERAHQFHVDFLEHAPVETTETTGASLANLSDRANAVTVVLSEILEHTRGFPHGGINE